MFKNLKNSIHAFLFPTEALRLLHLEEEVRGADALIMHMDEELEDQRDQKIQAQLAVGHARTEVQNLRQLDEIQKAVIVAMNRKVAQYDAHGTKWKGHAMELEQELSDSFFEIAELNKKLERAGTTDQTTDQVPQTGTALRLVA